MTEPNHPMRKELRGSISEEVTRLTLPVWMRHSEVLFCAVFRLLGCFAASQSAAAQLDQYGGWTGKAFETTGFFRVQKDGDAGRWWLATPEGNAFLSFGINHYHAGWWAQDTPKSSPD